MISISLAYALESPARYKTGVNLPSLSENLASLVERFYPLTWTERDFVLDTDERVKEDRGLIAGAQSGMRVESYLDGVVDIHAKIHAQQYQPGETPLRVNRFTLKELRPDAPSLADFRSDVCWCNDRGSYAYPACWTEQIFKPYRVTIKISYFAKRCPSSDVHDVSTQIEEEFLRIASATDKEVAEALVPLMFP